MTRVNRVSVCWRRVDKKTCEMCICEIRFLFPLEFKCAVIPVCTAHVHCTYIISSASTIPRPLTPRRSRRSCAVFCCSCVSVSSLSTARWRHPRLFSFIPLCSLLWSVCWLCVERLLFSYLNVCCFWRCDLPWNCRNYAHKTCFFLL